MTDEPTAPSEIEEGQASPPESEAPEGQAQETESPDQSQLQQNYDELRSEYTRRTQDWAEERQQAEMGAQQAFIEAATDPNHPEHAYARELLGMQATEEEGYEPDESEALQRRVEQMEDVFISQAQIAEQEAQEAQDLDELGSQIGQLPGHEEFSDHELLFLDRFSDAYRDEYGRRDVAGAHQALEELYDAKKQGWTSRKGTAQRPPGSGTAARKQFDINDPQQRLEAAENAAMAAGAD